MIPNRIVYVALGLALCGSADASVRSRTQAKVVHVAQTVTLGPSGLVSQVVADVGPAVYVRGAAALGKGASRISEMRPLTIATLTGTDTGGTKTICNPRNNSASYKFTDDPGYEPEYSGGCVEYPVDEADIKQALDTQVSTLAPSIAFGLASMVKEYGASTGIYTYEQEISGTDLSGKRRLVWSMIVDAGGRPMYGQAKVLRAAEYYLYVTYTPKKVADGLPQAWAYESAGRLAWTLVDKNMKAQTEIKAVDTGGFFDEPDDTIGSDDAVKCLIDHSQGGCSSGFPDVRTLLAETGASGAFVDYLHAVMPKYDNFENPAGSGNFTSIARLVMNVPSRVVTTTLDITCKIPTYTYSNSGQYQFQLSHSLTRYYVDQSKNGFSAMANMEQIVSSPWQSFSLSLGVGSELLPQLPALFIEPFGQEGPLVDVGWLPAGSVMGMVSYLPPPVCVPPTPAGPPVPPAGP